jgi:hydrogenase expression/formation protein HypC
MKIIEAGEFVSRCKGRNGEESVNMMLIGSQPEGTWILSFLGSAREVLSQEEAARIDRALDGLNAIMDGAENIDINYYFPDLEKK